MSVWDAVAAEGTRPQQLADTVALLSDAVGRAALRAAAQDPDGTLPLEVAPPQPSSGQRAAAQEAARVWQGLGVRVALAGDPAWPSVIDRVPGPPALLAWRGPDRLPPGPAVAVVGARRATPYGTGVAAWLAQAAAEAGVTVVSGGARGIDAAAHGASARHGTVVVLGCGHDVPYPQEHARAGGLFDRVLDGGGAIVSELLPGTPPRPGAVRSRNRIVAGLADAVVVVEGREGSGALVTAGVAADAGIEVLAVPGDVRAPGSAAPHLLLREGAAVCADPSDLLAALSVTGGPGAHGERGADTVSVLPPKVLTELRQRWPRPVRASALASAAGLTLPETMACIVRGRVAGEVAEGPEGVRLRRAP